MSEARGNPIVRSVNAVKFGVTARWRGLRERRPLVRHVAEAWSLLSDRNGNQYAAAITYFSFLALFPLLLLAVSVIGFVLHSDPELQQKLFDQVAQNAPGPFGETLQKSIESAISARASVGIIGLAGVLLTGLGWVGNVRKSIDAVWGCEPRKRNFAVDKGANLLVLAGLGVGMIASLGLTTVGVSATDQILDAVGLAHLPGMRVLVKVLGLVLAVAGDMLIFWWLLVRMPRVNMPKSVAVKGVLLAAVGFEVLKVVGTYTITHTANKPTAGPFAGVLAILIWIQLVARFLLFASAWMATLNADAESAARAAEVLPEPVALPIEGLDRTVRPATVGATLVGAGALIGAAATLAAQRRSPRS